MLSFNFNANGQTNLGNGVSSSNITGNNTSRIVSTNDNSANVIFEAANATFEVANGAFEVANGAFEVANGTSISANHLSFDANANGTFEAANGAIGPDVTFAGDTLSTTTDIA